MTISTSLQSPNYPRVNQELKPSTSPTVKWLHNHPMVQKTMIAALQVLGIAAFADGTSKLSIYKVTLGIIMMGSGRFLEKAIPLFIPPTFNPDKKFFKEGVYNGVSLTYEGNLPVLTIPQWVSAKDAGYARGFLMADQIEQLIAWNNLVFFTIPSIIPSRLIPSLPQKITDFINQILKMQLIPENYLEEMRGLVEGYNEKKIMGTKLTLHDVIYFHLLPELTHIDFYEADNWARRLQKNHDMGCTVVIDGDEATGPIGGRNLDWAPGKICGRSFFVEKRESPEGIRSIGQNLPLSVGFMTVMNEHGLCGAVNVARGLTDVPRGMPSILYLRKLIETCRSIKGEDGAEIFWSKNSPMGPFNLSLWDKKDAAGVHFYQNKDNSPNVRWWKPGNELIVTNFRYGENGQRTNPTPTFSEQREQEINSYYKKLREEGNYETTTALERLNHVIRGDEVNNVRTTTSAILNPNNIFHPVKENFTSSFGNGFAADQPSMNLPTNDWFNRSL